MTGPPKQRKKRQKRTQLKVEEDVEPTFGTITDAVAQGTSTSKKRSRKSEKAAPVHQAPSTIHFQELAQIWEGDRRIPTPASRHAWCLARNINPANINNWWYRRKAVAKKAKITIPGGTYDLPIGNPPDLSVKIEVEEALCDKITFQAKKSRKRVLTKTATAGFSSGNDLTRTSIPSSDSVTFLCASSETALSAPPTEQSSPFWDTAFIQPKRAYIQSSSPFPTILDSQFVSDSKFLQCSPFNRPRGTSHSLPSSSPDSSGHSPSLAPHDASPELGSCLQTSSLYSPDVAFPRPSCSKTQEGHSLCSNPIVADDAFTRPLNIPLLFLPDTHHPISQAPSLQTLFPSPAPLHSSNDFTNCSFYLTSIARTCASPVFICLSGSHYSLDGFNLFSASDENDCACLTLKAVSLTKRNDYWKPYTHTILEDPSYLPLLPDMYRV